jgi:hypothetical protein
MRRSLLFVVLTATLAAFTVATARAQVASIYVTYAPTHLTNVQTGTPPQYTTYWSNGVGGGVTINFLPLPVISLGVDFRGSTRPGTPDADTAQAGIKLTVRPPVIRAKPYVEAAAGYLGTRTVRTSSPLGSTANGNYITWEILGGIDYPVLHFVDLRLVEVGGGQAINTGSGVNPSLFTVNTGLVLHF